jgi:hypothetical protein
MMAGVIVASAALAIVLLAVLVNQLTLLRRELRIRHRNVRKQLEELQRAVAVVSVRLAILGKQQQSAHITEPQSAEAEARALIEEPQRRQFIADIMQERQCSLEDAQAEVDQLLRSVSDFEGLVL